MRQTLSHSGTSNYFPHLVYDHREAFLASLARNGDSEIDATRIAAVVAHPDDEAVGIAGQLRRLKGVKLVHVTDGAPHDLAFANYYGFETREAYRDARSNELKAALDLAGLTADAQTSLNIPDQKVAEHLVDTTKKLVEFFISEELEFVLTHPYEGGHPDHDATAFCVHFACRLLEQRGLAAPSIIEMASYFEGESGGVYQKFIAHPERKETIALLSENQKQLKAGMFAAHASQQSCLCIFHSEEERFRIAPEYDFRALPNSGVLHYNTFRSGMTARRWQQLTREAICVLEKSAAAA